MSTTLLTTHHNPVSLDGISRPVITVGTFDGVHTGHRTIIRRMTDIAAAVGGASVLVTFDPHPRIVLHRDEHLLWLLNTMDEKASILNRLGVDHLVVLPFNEAFSALSEKEFVEEYLVKRFGIHHLVVGFNHRFGHDRLGGFDSLKAYGQHYHFGVEEIPRHEMNEATVSSTLIRKALLEGDLQKANAMLGEPYRMAACVVHGRHIGTPMGFPTANLKSEHPYKLIPAHGVYAVTVEVRGKCLGGMCNIGIRPTFDGKEMVTEANIFNFEGDLYGECITLGFVARIREEKRFASREALIAQLHDDRRDALSVLKKYGYAC